MINEMIVVSVTPFSGTSNPDKNGEFPVMLQCIAGKMPNRNVLSGTVAKRAEIQVGKTYLMMVREQGTDKLFGQDFTFIKIKELETGKDIVESCKDLGPAVILNVNDTRPIDFEEKYERKGNAIESNRTERIKSGDYQPAGPTSVTHHETASKVVKGSSQEASGKILDGAKNTDALNQ